MRLEIELFDDAKNGIPNIRAEAFQTPRFIRQIHGVQMGLQRVGLVAKQVQKSGSAAQKSGKVC
jgi:hypothetical protein